MDNNLNFDSEKYFGLGVTAFNFKFQNTQPIRQRLMLFDASGLNIELVGRGTSAQQPPFLGINTAGSSVSPEAMAKSTFSYPLNLKGIIYRVDVGDVQKQMDRSFLDFSRCAIDGRVKRAGDIQPNYLRRNWFFQDNLIVMTGDIEVNQNTALTIDIEKNTTLDLVFLVDSID